jgi:hypothetical protein
LETWATDIRGASSADSNSAQLDTGKNLIIGSLGIEFSGISIGHRLIPSHVPNSANQAVRL